jgi:ABC-type multidrug transport system fused ATPase/permease subunit
VLLEKVHHGAADLVREGAERPRSAWAVRWPKKHMVPPGSPYPTSVLTLFAMASPLERVKLAIACACLIASGTVQSLLLIIMGSAYGVASVTHARTMLYYFCAIGAGATVSRWVAFTLIERCRESQLARLKTAYLESIARQDIGWIDTSKPQELSAAAGESFVAISDGLAQKCWTMIEYRARFIASITLGFIFEPRVAVFALARRRNRRVRSSTRWSSAHAPSHPSMRRSSFLENTRVACTRSPRPPARAMFGRGWPTGLRRGCSCP